MKSRLLFLSFALIFSATAMLLGQTADVCAIGAPTDNITMPNLPTADEVNNEIKPSVNYVLLGPSSQPEDLPPSFISDFIGASEKDKFKVTADENWYLDVDINMPGWLYICEYFPTDEGFQGKWIAYKWQLLQSGIWRLGPFTPGDNEPEGQHIYRLWFYSDGQWAAENQNDPQNNLIYWMYSKGQPAEQPVSQIAPQPLPTPQEATFSDKAYEFITQPIVLVLGSLILVIIVILGLYMYWRHGRRGSSQAAEAINEADTQELSAVLSSDVASAKIVLPNGAEIQLAGTSRVIGRSDLARALSLDELGLISRRHFEVKSDDEQFYIEDIESANGTKLNGEDISGKGPVSLNNDDIIEPAGTIQLKFLLL